MNYQKRFSLIEQRFVSARANPPAEHFAVQITLTGNDAGIFYIANTPRGFEVAPYDYRDNTAALTISGDDLVRFLGGRLHLDRALESGRIQFTGNADHIRLLAQIADSPTPRNRKETI